MNIFFLKKRFRNVGSQIVLQTNRKSNFKDTINKITKVTRLAPKITRHEQNYSLDFECKPSLFYGLPIIHKSKMINNACMKTDEEYLEFLDPPTHSGRPSM